MEDFLILLQAKLDEAKSKGLINSDITALQGQLDKLRLQVELDPKAVSNLTKEIEKVINQKITISNINVDTGQIAKGVQQTGQKIANDINKAVQETLNIDTVINNALKRQSQLTGREEPSKRLINMLNSVRETLTNNTELMKMFNNAVSQTFDKMSIERLIRDLQWAQKEMSSTEEIAKQFNKTISSQFTTQIPETQKIKTDIFEICRAFQEYSKLYNYYHNNRIAGDSDEVSNNILFERLKTCTTQAQKDIMALNGSYREFQNFLTGVSFNYPNLFLSVQNLDLDYLKYYHNEIDDFLQLESKLISESNLAEKELQELRTVLINTFGIDIVKYDGTLTVTRDQLQAVVAQCPQAKKYIDEINSSLVQISQSEQKEAQQSSSTANTVVQNEEKKQQAYRDTADAQKSANGKTFDLSQNKQKIKEFRTSLENLGTVDGKYVDDLSNRFNKLHIQIQSINASLSEGAVHQKGEYIGTKQILTSTLTGIDEYGKTITLTESWDQTNREFVKSLDAVGISFKEIQKHATDYENKLNNLKTKMSGTDFNASNFEGMIQQFRSGEITVEQLSSAFNQLENSANASLKKLNSKDTSLNQITQTENNMRNLPSMINSLEAGMDGLKDKTSLADISVEDLRKDFQSLQDVMNNNGGKIPLADDWINKYQLLMSTVKSAVKQVEALKKAEVSDNSAVKLAAQANKIQLSIDTGDYDADVNALISKTKLLTDENGRAAISTDELKNALKELTAASNAYTNNRTEETQKRLIAAAGKLDVEYKKVFNTYKTMNAELISDTRRLNQVNSMQQWADNNTKALKKYGVRIKDVIDQMNDLSQTMNKADFTKLVNEFKKIQAEARSTGDIGFTLLDKINNAWAKFGGWSLATTSMMFLITQAKQALSELKEIDSIVTEISKVSDLSLSELKQLTDASFEKASKYGRTAADYLTGIQEMSRAGFHGEAAEQMAELSILAQSAGDLQKDLANDYIIASNAAFGYAGNVEKLNALLDAQNQVTNRNAVSMEELADATKVAANQLANANIKENELTALLGTGIATSRESGETVGRALKGIIMNIQQVKGESGFDGEIIDEEALKKVEARCHSVGVELEYMKDGIVRLRNPMEVLKELAEVYNSLPDDSAEKAGIISDIGGKYRGNILSSILSNWSQVEKMLSDYENATGSAMQEAMKSANDWEGSLNRLKNTWTDTVENIANSDAITTIINGFNGLLSIVNKFTDSIGSFGTIGLGAGLFATLQNIGECRMSVRISN